MLGPPSKVANIRSKMSLDTFDDDDYLDDTMSNNNQINQIKTKDGKTLLLTKDYRAALDIISAYKSLKQAVVKSTNLMMKDSVNNATNRGNSKGYLKMTIAAQ